MRVAGLMVLGAALAACSGDDTSNGSGGGTSGSTSAGAGGTDTSTGTGGSAGSGGDHGGGGGAGGAYLVMARAELEGLSTATAAWDYLKARADEAVAITLDAASSSSPWLPNYNDSGQAARVPARYLAAAFVVASSYSGDKTPYRQATEAALLHIVGSEEEASTDGTAAGDRLLATARQLPAWVLAADLIALDRSLPGTRSSAGSETGTDWTATSFEAWLGGVLAKTIGTHGRWTSIAQTQESSAANWGAHCAASRVAVSLYLGDGEDVDRAATVLRGALGDSSAYPAYPDGQTPAAGAGFQTTSSFDSSWSCNHTSTIGGWRPINSAACGNDMDGIVVEDISRSAGAYPSYDDTGLGYTFETMAGLHLASLLLDRQGPSAFSWSDDGLLRAMQWLDRQGEVPGASSVRQHVPWITNHFYGTSLPTDDARMGRGFGFTDWLYP